MFCPQCGAPNDEDSIFCGNCGAVLDAEAIPAEGEAQVEVEAAVEGQEVLPEVLAEPPPPPSTAPRPPRPPLPPSVPTSGMAVASLVLGIGGLTVLPLLGSILGIIFGYMARRDIRQRPDEVSGEGLALAGIIMGWIAVGLAVLGFLVFGAFALCGVCGAFGASS